jgi:hypothetical protein
MGQMIMETTRKMITDESRNRLFLSFFTDASSCNMSKGNDIINDKNLSYKINNAGSKRG